MSSPHETEEENTVPNQCDAHHLFHEQTGEKATLRGYVHTRVIMTTDFDLQCFEIRALPLSSHDSATSVDMWINGKDKSCVGMEMWNIRFW